jgi:CubicO group peptidase (beta-lactamase class C family)
VPFKAINSFDEIVLQRIFVDPEKAKQMTLEQLLSHTSGLEYDDQPRIGPDGQNDPNVRVSTLNERFIYQATLAIKYEHKHEPGKGIGLYSNLGFDVAAWMLELAYNDKKEHAIPQIPFSQIIRDELFTAVFKLSEETRIAPGASGNGDVIQAGCGDMVSSIADLLKVAQVLQNGEEKLSAHFGKEWHKKMLAERGSDGTYNYGLGCEANASSIQFSGLNYEIFADGIGRDVTAHVAFPLHQKQPAIVAMCNSNALGPQADQVKFRQELRKLAGLTIS